MPEQSYTQTYNSFSGCDMIVTFGGKIIGELQGLRYTVNREKSPLYTMGSADPRSFSRGKRGIAGSMVFLVFDRSALLSTLGDRSRYLANRYELYQSQVPITKINDRRIANTFGGSSGSVGQANIGANTIGGNIITSEKVLAPPVYADQIPPFEVVITAGNEYGHLASFALYGVEIMNCGSGMSIDDITTDEACTFMATGIKPWNNQYHINLQSGFGAIPRQDFSSSLSGAR